MHDYDEEEVKKIINPYIGSKFILLDAINFNVKGFRYFHDYKFLMNNYNIKKKEFKEEPDRSFFILEKNMINYKTLLEEKLFSKKKCWLITGVAGFIGSNILETLLSNNQYVIGVDNFSTGKKKYISKYI